MRVVRHPRTHELFDVLLIAQAFVLLRSHKNGDEFVLSARDFRTMQTVTHPSVRNEI